MTNNNNTWGRSLEINQLPEGARLMQFGHRSGAEQHERCPRAYYLQYEYLGTGIMQKPTPLHLVVGSAVHLGLAAMLREEGIDIAVRDALAWFKDTLAYQLLNYDQQVEQEVLVHGLLYAFYVYAYPSLTANFEVITVETGAVEYVPVSQYCPQCNGMSLGIAEDGSEGYCKACRNTGECMEWVAIQSRPDAILRNRKTGEVAGWSWKTIDDPTDMRRSQLHNDLQGFMEMYYGEKILEKLRGRPFTSQEISDTVSMIIKGVTQLDDYSPTELLHDLEGFINEAKACVAKSRADIPTSIDYIQTVFLVKGKRKQLAENAFPEIGSDSYASNTDTDDEYGGYQPGRIYRQMSHLCYRYRNGNPEVQSLAAELYKSGPNKGKPKPFDTHNPNFVEESWAYKFFKPDNQTASGLSTKWLTSPIQPDQVREWINRLNAGAVYPSTMNDERNPHPLAKIIQFEQPLYRNVDKAVGHVMQTQRRYVQIAQAVQRMNDYHPEDNPLAIMDQEFPQHLISCRTPWRCSYHDFCHTPREAELDFATIPDGFELRQPHHAIEKEFRDKQTAVVEEQS